MAFVNLSLLAGGVLVALPVVLHLLMRQRPKQFVFPALRFVHERRLVNQRQLQLRHWLLLALRCGAIALLVLALARPRVSSASLSSWLLAGMLALLAAFSAVVAMVSRARGSSRMLVGGFGAIAAVLTVAGLFAAGRAFSGRSPVLGDQEAPVAAAIVIDTSPRMQYRQENQTRLELAQETAQWLLRQLPAESDIALFDSRSASGAFAADRSTAERAVARLQQATAPRPLVDVIEAAVQTVKQKPLSRKEVYVFSDLAAAAWRADSSSQLQKILAEQADTLLYVIDVGASQPRNFAFGELRLSGDRLPAGADLQIDAEVSASGSAGQRTIELWVERTDPTLPIIRDGKAVLPTADLRESRTLQLPASGSENVQFRLTGLATGTHNGWLRIVGQDGLAIDDVRYFTVEVQAAWPVLLVAPSGTSTRYLSEVLAPLPLRQAGQASFRCESIEQSRLATQELADFRAVALLDPAPLTPEVWQKLAEYCRQGGGLAIFLGNNAQPPVSFQNAAALSVLGGKLARLARTGGEVFVSPNSYEHPILAGLRAYATSVPWEAFPVFYHWNLDDLGSDARAIVTYSDGKPAVIENRMAAGNVLIMTTPISDPPRPTDHPAWNELATGEEAWPCFALVYEMMLHLVRSGQARLNLLAGETATLANDPAVFPERYQLYTPLDQPQEVRAREAQLLVRFTDQPGHYRLRGQKDGPLVRGFAVNLAGDTSDLTRIREDDLSQLLGVGRYKIARSKGEIDRAVDADRVGSEFYPLLVSLLAVVFGLEHVLANRFYRSRDR